MQKKLLCIFGVSVLLTSCGTLKKPKESVTFSKADHPYIEKFHEGVRLKQRGQLKEAITLFESCLVSNPNDDAVHYALSQLYLETKQLNKSMESIQKAAKIDPKNPWYIEELAYMYYQQKNFVEAAKNFQKLVEKEPRNTEWLFSYAECLMRSKDEAGAIKALDKLEDQMGVNPELSIEKFRLYRQLKQDEKALNEINKGLKVYPKDPQLLANLVDYYFEKKQQNKAYDYLILLAEADPDNGNAQMALAQYYDQIGDRKLSFEALKKGFQSDDIALDQKMKILLSIYETQPNVDADMMELNTILVNKYPTEAKVYAMRGDFYLKNKQDQEALNDFSTALKYDVSRFAIWDQVLIMHYQNRDFETLYTESKKCLELFPTMVNVYLLHGISANQTKRYQEALDAIDLGQDLIVNDDKLKAEFYAQKGEAYFGLKQYSEAKDSYNVALKLVPNQITTLNNFAYYLALSKLDLDEAEKMIRVVLEKAPGESRYLDTYGWILFQKGNYEEAKKIFENAFQIRSTDKLINEHLGDVYFKLGKITEAVQYWIKAKELGATNKVLNKKIDTKTYYEPIY